jgi:hypothetical protein
MTVVLAGFGMTYRVNSGGNRIELIPLPQAALVIRSYPTTLAQIRLQTILRQFPQAEYTQASGTVKFRGTEEEHARLERLLRGQTSATRPRSGRTRVVHTLRVRQQPVGAILKTLERQLELQFEYAAGVPELLTTRVTFDVRDVPLDELLEATLKPASLRHRREGDVIQIEKAD